METTIKEMFKKVKNQLGPDKSCIIYEELDDDGIELGNWCICYGYEDYKDYTDNLLPNIKEYMGNVLISLNNEYSFRYKSENNRYYTFKFRFRFVDNCTTQNIVDAVNADGYSYMINPGDGTIIQKDSNIIAIMNERYGNQIIQ